jgi:hypothetical protein
VFECEGGEFVDDCSDLGEKEVESCVFTLECGTIICVIVVPTIS